MDLNIVLHQRAAQTSEASQWRPQRFELSNQESRAALAELLSSGAIGAVHDTIADQVEELICLRQPDREFSDSKLKEKIREHLRGTARNEYGCWVYYPWLHRLVHVLPETEYREVRSSRNRHKILDGEQQRLCGAVIGIIGLSVGQSAAVTLALEGVSRFRLADFDTLSLSNMNRIRAGVADLGMNKAVLAARQMFEIDPYVDIAIFPEGISEDNLDTFLAPPAERKLDLLIEECDDLWLKIRVRERAREQGIPVIMETSERGLVDIERFDREPDRPLLHGRLGPIRADALWDLSTEEKVPIVLRMLDPDRLSPAGAASLLEIDRSITTWPQLASSVALGGAITTDVARRILLGSFTKSGRFHVDVETLVNDETAKPPLTETDSSVDSPVAQAAPIPRPPRRSRGPVSQEEIRYIVAHGVLAPSGGNMQPWRFQWRGNQLLAYRDPKRSSSLLNFEHSATYMAFGAAVENIHMAACSLGLKSRITPFPDSRDPLLVCSLSFDRTETTCGDPVLFEQVSRRCTNRKLGDRSPLRQSDASALLAAADDSLADLQLISEKQQLEEMGAILGAGDQLRFLSPNLHHQMITELRHSKRDVQTTRDGIDIATLELSATGRAIMPILSSAPAMEHLRRVDGGGRKLQQPARDAIAAAGAVGLLTVAGTIPHSYFHGGRIMQRVWLMATAQRLALHPMTALLYLFARVERGAGRGLDKTDRQCLAELRQRYRSVFDVLPDRAEVMLFRLSYAPPPPARSLRRSIDDVLSFEQGNVVAPITA